VVNAGQFSLGILNKLILACGMILYGKLSLQIFIEISIDLLVVGSQEFFDC
jgi:hypothetical protein